MQEERTAEIIDLVKHMTEQEVSVLEAFISGLRAGKSLSDKEGRSPEVFSPICKGGS